MQGRTNPLTIQMCEFVLKSTFVLAETLAPESAGHLVLWCWMKGLWIGGWMDENRNPWRAESVSSCLPAEGNTENLEIRKGKSWNGSPGQSMGKVRSGKLQAPAFQKTSPSEQWTRNSFRPMPWVLLDLRTFRNSRKEKSTNG